MYFSNVDIAAKCKHLLQIAVPPAPTFFGTGSDGVLT